MSAALCVGILILIVLVGNAIHMSEIASELKRMNDRNDRNERRDKED